MKPARRIKKLDLPHNFFWSVIVIMLLVGMFFLSGCDLVTRHSDGTVSCYADGEKIHEGNFSSFKVTLYGPQKVLEHRFYNKDTSVILTGASCVITTSEGNP